LNERQQGIALIIAMTYEKPGAGVEKITRAAEALFLESFHAK